jgi:Taurine catabolism dioxygenase TauD, TfdA family
MPASPRRCGTSRAERDFVPLTCAPLHLRRAALWLFLWIWHILNWATRVAWLVQRPGGVSCGRIPATRGRGGGARGRTDEGQGWTRNRGGHETARNWNRIRHRRFWPRGALQQRGEHKNQLVVPQHELLRSTHKSVVWQHPRTRLPPLFDSQQISARIVGLAPDESELLLEQLFAHLYRPEVVFDHEWRPGDLVVWDNLAVQHARGNVEIEGPERTLRKTIGPIPVQTGISKPTMVPAGAR